MTEPDFTAEHAMPPLLVDGQAMGRETCAMASTNLPAFAPADHPLVAAWNEMLSTLDAYIHTPGPDDEALWQRLRELETQIENARPDDLVGLAVQCRYLEHSLSSGPNAIQVVLSGWIARALARLAGVEYVA